MARSRGASPWLKSTACAEALKTDGPAQTDYLTLTAARVSLLVAHGRRSRCNRRTTPRGRTSRRRGGVRRAGAPLHSAGVRNGVIGGGRSFGCGGHLPG